MACYSTFCQTRRRSSNIVSSSGGNRSNAVKALPIIIDLLREGGYSFLTIDEMIILEGLSETEDGLFEGY